MGARCRPLRRAGADAAGQRVPSGQHRLRRRQRDRRRAAHADPLEKPNMRRALYLAAIVVLLGAAAAWPATQAAVSAPGAPLGTTAIALDGQVGIGWQPVQGATSYQVLRSTSASSSGSQIAAGITDTRYVDTTAVNG